MFFNSLFHFRQYIFDLSIYRFQYYNALIMNDG